MLECSCQDDSYHKEVTDEKMNSKSPRSTSEPNHRARKPDRVVYHPPKQMASVAKEKESVEVPQVVQDKEVVAPTHPLFKLEYEDAEGQVHNLLVWENSDLAELSHSFGKQVGLDPPLEAALHRRLVEEYDKFKT